MIKSKTKLALAKSTLFKHFFKIVGEKHKPIITSLKYVKTSEIEEMMKKDKRKVYVEKLKKIDDDIFIGFNDGLTFYKGKLKSDDKMGLFDIQFSNGSHMLMAKWYHGISFNVVTLLIGEVDTWKNLLKLRKGVKKRQLKPKAGIFSMHVSNEGIVAYNEHKDWFEGKVYHREIKKVINDMKYFFEHKKQFLRFGMPGIRKVLMTGEPGTGKTSIIAKIARESKDWLNIVYISRIDAIAYHLKVISKYNVPTLIILEDADSALGNADANVINLLDGRDMPICKAGVYMIMTTNRPNEIDDRIKRRPGRIDSIFNIGALENGNAVKCAQMYFEGIFEVPDDTVVFDNKTGAQIKELANSTASYAVGNNKEISIELIKKVWQEMNDAIKEMDKQANKIPFKKNSKTGFGEGTF